MITSLSRTASPFSSCRAEWCRRALATSAYAETSSASSMPPRVDKKMYNRSGEGSVRPRIFVRPWDGVPSMLDGFAMLRGIEDKYGKIRAFTFVRDGEIPSLYFSYFWVELEDPTRYDQASTVFQVPVPEVDRKRPGGVGIADLQPFLRPLPETQEGAQEWAGVTERMVDEVDESKRKNKVYDIRIMPTGPHMNRSTNLIPTKRFFLLTEAFVKWGGFSSSPSQATTDPSAKPMLDDILKRGSLIGRTDHPTTTTTASTTKDETPPPPTEEPHKPFNHDFDEPVRSTETQTSPTLNKPSSLQPQSLLTMQREGKRLSRKQKALLQAAAISRTPLPNPEEKAAAEAKETEAAPESRMETDEEKQQFQNKVWNLVRAKWF